jgi:photosystem II stability/assembly factor-like uncharacterized protein
MKARVFISTLGGKGLARAERGTRGNWSVETLLEGQDVRCLVADPHNSNIVYAGTHGEGVLRSDDSGKTWQPAGMEAQVVKSIAFCRAEPGAIYVGTRPPAIFVSRDGGNSWTELESFRRMREPSWKTPTESEPYVLGLAVSPTDPNVIVAGVEAGAVLRSGDGGKTWEGHLKGTAKDCHSLTFHTTNGNWIYQGGGGWPAAVSQDSGLTWKQPRKGMRFSLYGWGVAADPQRPEIWYVSAAPLSTFPLFFVFPTAHWDGHAHASIFRSTEEGRWTRLSGGLPQPLDYMAYALLTDPEAPGHLYAGLSNGDVWHTVDYGDHWQRLPLNLGSVARSMIMLH